MVCVGPYSTTIKIIDFGTAKLLKPGEKAKTMSGTPEFVSPEVVSYDYVTPATDMWSVGVITYILLSGFSPFMGDTDAETFSNIVRWAALLMTSFHFFNAELSSILMSPSSSQYQQMPR